MTLVRLTALVAIVMAAVRRRLLGARRDLVEVRRKRERSSPAAQRESCPHVESIVNAWRYPEKGTSL